MTCAKKCVVSKPRVDNRVETCLAFFPACRADGLRTVDTPTRASRPLNSHDGRYDDLHGAGDPPHRHPRFVRVDW
jgi:hypothetical protein